MWKSLPGTSAHLHAAAVADAPFDAHRVEPGDAAVAGR